MFVDCKDTMIFSNSNTKMCFFGYFSAIFLYLVAKNKDLIQNAISKHILRLHNVFYVSRHVSF